MSRIKPGQFRLLLCLNLSARPMLAEAAVAALSFPRPGGDRAEEKRLAVLELWKCR